MNALDAESFRKKFLSIVDELRAALGYPARDTEPEPGDELAMEMMYGNFDFSVVHSQRFRPEKILIECEFGEVPESRKMAVIERLLQMNVALAEHDGSVFCLDRDGAKLIYVLPMYLMKLSGNGLLSKMTEIVWHGRRWVETRYLAEDRKEPNEILNPVFLA